MDIEVIKDFSTTIKHSKQRDIPDTIKEYFGKIKNETLLNQLFTFCEQYPSYKKLMTLVIKHLKTPIHCVYILKEQDVVVYVGKSDDVCVRLNTHSKEKDFDEVFIIETKDKRSQDFCENSLIWKYKPKYNKSVNIKSTNGVVNFEKEVVDFKDWLNHASWFSGISQALQKKLNCKLELKSFNSFVDIDYSINFKTDTSIVLVEVIENTVKECVNNFTIKRKLQQAAESLNKPELFSVVTDGMYKFGKFYISGKGKWRVEGGKTWYQNVNIDKLVQETIDSFNVVGITTSLDCVPMWFGKYKGKLFSDIKLSDPTYCDWIVKTFKQSELMRLGAI